MEDHEKTDGARQFVVEFPCPRMTKGMPRYLGQNGVVDSHEFARRFTQREADEAANVCRSLGHSECRVCELVTRVHVVPVRGPESHLVWPVTDGNIVWSPEKNAIQ